MAENEIVIVELAPRPALAIRATAKTLKMPRVMGDAYQKIKARIDREQIAADDAGMPFCVYHDLDWERLNEKGLTGMFRMLFTHRWDLEMGMPTARKAPGADGMHSIEMPAGRHIRAVHLGPYMKVGDAYTRIRGYAAAAGINFGRYSMEVYTNDPTEVAKKDIRTEVYVSIA